MKREKVLVWGSLGLLTVALVLTLLPLLLMFYTSFKPGGTLFKQSKDIVVADFNTGETNSIGGIISSNAILPSLVETTYGPDRLEGAEGRSHTIRFDALGGDETSWFTTLGQDLRKFKFLEFYVKGGRGGETFSLEFKDMDRNKASLKIEKFLPQGLTTDWQRVRIPMSEINPDVLDPDIPAQKAEELCFRFDGTRSGTIHIDDLRLVFRKTTWSNYTDVMISGPFGRYFFNSALIALIATFGNLFFSSMVGYAFARKEFPGKRLMFMLIVGSIMIPPQVLMIPMFILMKNIGWLNTYWALTVPALVLPFNVFLMRQYISKLPIAMEDAARVDGAGDFRIFFWIIMPLAKPALAVIGINTFMGSWNTFLYPFILTNTTEMRTLPVGLALYKSLHGVDWVHLMAGSAISALPVIIVFLCFQRYIIAGLTAGSVKG